MTLGKDIKTLLFAGNEILRLKRELQDCIRTDNLDRAIEVRQELKKLENKRSSLDLIYETSRFERSLVMHAPSEAYLAEERRVVDEA